MCFCGGIIAVRAGVPVLCFLAVHAFSYCRCLYYNRNYPYQKMLTEVHIMKVIVMKSPKAFAWLFRLIFMRRTASGDSCL